MIRHPNLVQYYGKTNYGEARGYFGIVMEFIPGGNLRDFLNNRAIQFIEWILVKRMSQEIADGLAYLHNYSPDKRITHGDIKPSNILLTKTLHCKIADFGSSTIQSHTEMGVDTTTHGPGVLPYSERFAAPERSLHPNRYTTQMDVYSFGEVVNDMMTRGGKDMDEVLLSVTNTQDRNIVKLLFRIIKKAQKINPQDRVSMLYINVELLNNANVYNADVNAYVQSIMRFNEVAEPMPNAEFVIPVSEWLPVPSAELAPGNSMY